MSEAPSHGRSIIHYDNKSVGALKYIELAQELDNQVYGKSDTTKMEAPAPQITEEQLHEAQLNQRTDTAIEGDANV